MEIILPKFGLFFWTLIIFVTLFLVLRKLAWGPILKALHDREENISAALRMAEEAKAEMATLKADNEKLLQEARIERDKMLRDASVAREELLAKAKEEAVQVSAREVEKARVQIESERMAAVTALKNEAGMLAIEIAEKILRKELAAKSEKEAMAKRLISELSQN